MHRILLFIFLLPEFLYCQNSNLMIPTGGKNRKSTAEISLTEIGQFGIMRKARPNVPAHYHTGIDIKRPVENYDNEPVFPVAEGIIMSIRNDGPYAQIIIVHKTGKLNFWTVYEHIAGIKVKSGETVNSNTQIARFMNKSELDKYGWKFNHIHFEVLKFAPYKLKYDAKHPDRKFGSYTLVCYSKEELEKHYYHPLEFIRLNSKY